MISNENYDAYKATPPCNVLKMCSHQCPYFEDCWPTEEEEDEDFFYY